MVPLQPPSVLLPVVGLHLRLLPALSPSPQYTELAVTLVFRWRLGRAAPRSRLPQWLLLRSRVAHDGLSFAACSEPSLQPWLRDSSMPSCPRDFLAEPQP